MRGFSGDIAYRDGYRFVKESEKNIKRLLHQAHKQKKYFNRLWMSKLKDTFRVPIVWEISHNGFKMEYINGHTILEVMKNHPESLEYIADAILELIDWEFENSVKRPFRLKPFINKLTPACPPEFQAYVISQAKKLRFKWIDYGMNHGDLTMANMIFTRDSIYLIDFLKTFLRTPYQDIAKLLQEIDFHWAKLMSDYDEESSAIKFGYDYLNDRIQKHLQEHYSDKKDIIRVFHFMCLCRLFPYAKDDQDIKDLIYYRCKELIENEDSY